MEIKSFYYVLGGFMLDFYALGLMCAFGLHLILVGRKKSNEIGKQYSIGIGLFFLSVAISAITYSVDLAHRTFIGGRLFPASAEYKEMGFEFASLHPESYFLAILLFLLLAFSFLMKPIELYMLNRPKAVMSKMCIGLAPLPVLIRIFELLTLPQEGSGLYWVFTGLFAVVWLMVVITALSLLSIYFRMAIKSTGDVRKRGFAVVVAMLVWLASIFTRPTFLKQIAENPYSFWIMGVIEFSMLSLFVYGFAQNMEYEFSESKRDYLYQNWFFQVVIVGFWLLVGFYFSIVFWSQDLLFVEIWEMRALTDASVDNFGNFMDRSIAEGDEGLGGQDITYLVLIPFVLIYLLSLLPQFRQKFEKPRIYAGFIIMSAIVLAIVNRGFKGFFCRARPGKAMEDPSNYTPMWTFGTLSFDDGLSSGSFTSGHTTTAVILVALGFILIKTHKTWLITLTFTATIAWTAIMGAGRVVHGAHYPGDTLWALLVGIALIAWVYFFVLKIPEQEAGTFKLEKIGAELVWGIYFIFFAVFILAFLAGIKYTVLEFEWYWALAIVVGPIGAYLIKKRDRKSVV